MKFLHLHLPSTNDSGSEAWFRDMYTGENKLFAAYRALWPDRYSRERLEGLFNVIHPYYKRAQYDLVPSMGELGYFDTEKLLRYKYPVVEQCWIAVDAAQTQTENGSYTSFIALGNCEGLLKVLAVKRGRWRQDQMHAELFEFYAYISRLTSMFPEAIVTERAAGGYGIIDFLSGQLPIIPIIPRGSKEERAAAVCWLVNTGRVSVPEAPDSQMRLFLEELENFPLCTSKDWVDAFVHALSYASRPAEFKPVPVEGVQQYDALGDPGHTLDADMDGFDKQMRDISDKYGAI